MNPQDELLEIIDTYLNKGMSKEERFAFEERMAQDQTLADKVHEVRLTNEAIYYASLAELKNTIGKDIKKITYKPEFNWKKATYISIASLVLLSGVTTYLVTTNSKDESGREEITKSTEKIKQNSAKNNSAAPILQHASDEKKSIQIQSGEKEGTKDSIAIDNLSTKKSILPVDNKLIPIEKTKPLDSEKNAQSTTTDPTIKKIIPPVATDNVVICDKSFTMHSEASCKLKETGSIVITSDGAYSYTFQVDTRSSSGSKAVFQSMPAGGYEVLVTYGKECIYTKKVTVAEKWCAMNEPYSFNPDYNEKWIMSYETGASGTFTIFDKSGKEVYSNAFGSGNEEWNGNDRQGTVVPVGIYIAFINYSDGRKEKVELTVVR